MSERWSVQLICCGRDDGLQVCRSWREADAFRQGYAATQGHDRQGIVSRSLLPLRLGYHDPAPTEPQP